jgi:hypothetical protein
MAWARRRYTKKTAVDGTESKPKRARKNAEPKQRTSAKTAKAHRVVQQEELAPEGEFLVSFSIPGRPATKKNHQKIVYVMGSPKIVPASNYKEYEKACKAPCKAAWQDTGKEPMDFGVAVVMKVYLPNWSGVGDHNGYMQSIGDILQEHGVIYDDMWIAWESDSTHWFGIDKDNPRVDLTIYRRRHPYEDYRRDKEETEAKKEAKRAAKAPPDSSATTNIVW